ncbi:MAG: cytochrome c biogenesis protein CcsA, partial [Bradymonadaceae bacterium]
MKWIGSFAIYIALYVSVLGVFLSFAAGRTGSRRFMQASRFSAYTVFGAISVASAVLLHAFLTHDFSISYVAGFSDRTMPLFYLIGAFWGGQAGSLLFWILKVTLFTSACIYINRNSYQDFMPWVTMVCLAVTAGLLVILTFGSNPFEGFTIIDDPTTGKGLNPLLQTPKMILHPPALLTGMAAMTIPFAFAIAALLSGNLSNSWVEAARKWILIPWLFLSVGNILGGMWAYEELGWGGYWAWDPVENAAFLPWLTATALIHSLLIQERRGMLKRWNV